MRGEPKLSSGIPLQPTLCDLSAEYRIADSGNAGVTHSDLVRMLQKIDDLHYGTPENSSGQTSVINGSKDY